MATIVAKQDRLKSGIERIVRAIWPRIDYSTPYSAVVKAQLGDGSLDLQFDDARMPGGATGGVQGIPIDTGIPGVTFTIAVGARVLVVFADGDPSKPRVTEWESASVQQVVVTSAAIKLGGPSATEALVKGTSFASHMGQLSTALTALQTALTPMLLPPAAAAAKVAVGQAIAAANSLAADVSAQNTTL